MDGRRHVDIKKHLLFKGLQGSSCTMGSALEIGISDGGEQEENSRFSRLRKGKG